MPKFTPEFIEKVRETYRKELSYSKTAKKLKIDERAVKRLIEADRKATEQQAISEQGAASDQQGPGGVVKGNKESSVTQQHGSTASDLAMKYKVIYSEMFAGKSGPQIIAEHGFDPEFVDKQVRRFYQQRECDPVVLQKKILTTLNGIDSHEAKPYLESFEQKGYLSNDQVVEVIRKIIKKKGDFALTRIFSHPDADPPIGWSKLRCTKCGKSYGMVRNSDEIIQLHGSDWGGWWHVRCGPYRETM